MLTDERAFNAIVDLAREDIRAFFNLNFDISNYDSLLRDLRGIDPTHFTYRYNRMGPLEFSESLIKWLEHTRHRATLTRPWVGKRNGRATRVMLYQFFHQKVKLVLWNECDQRLAMPSQIRNLTF